MEVWYKLGKTVGALHKVIWPNEDVVIFVTKRDNPLLPKELIQIRDRCYVINPKKIEIVLQEMRNQGAVSEETTDYLLVALAAQMVREKAINRGLIQPFDYETIDQIRKIVYPPETAEICIQAFYQFASMWEGDSKQGDAFMIMMIVIEMMPKIEDLSKLKDIILLSPA